MYGLYIDDVKGTCSPITDTVCVKYKKKIYCCFGIVKAELLHFSSHQIIWEDHSLIPVSLLKTFVVTCWKNQAAFYKPRCPIVLF
jgi:hypothetical protein